MSQAGQHLTEPIDFDPRLLDLDPYPRWARLRDEEPFFYNERLDFYMLSRHADVAAALRDWRTYSSAGGNILDLMKRPDVVERHRNMLFEDPEPHEVHRKALAGVFTPRRIAELERSVRAICSNSLAGWGEEPFEFVTRFASHVPMAVVGALLGLPSTDYSMLAAVVAAYSDRVDDTGGGLAAREELAGYLAEQLDHARRVPGSGLLNALVRLRITDEKGERPLTDEEALNQAMLITLAGNETTSKLFGWVVETLARFPAQRRLIELDRSLIPNAAEEIVRFETPAHFFGRTTSRAVSWHGREAPAGAHMMLLVGAAGRDERVFPDPNRFDVRRRIGNNQLGYGAGIHYCLGAPLARLELRVSIDEMLRRCGSWDIDYDEAEPLVTPSTRGWRTLPVVFE